MMLRHMGWKEAADLILTSLEKAIGSKEGDLRLCPTDGRCHPGVELLGLWSGDDRQM